MGSFDVVTGRDDLSRTSPILLKPPRENHPEGSRLPLSPAGVSQFPGPPLPNMENGNPPYLRGMGLKSNMISWSVHPINVRAGLGTARLPRGKEPRGDPGKRVAIEEAPQLPAGKRVVPKPDQALFFRQRTYPDKVSQLRAFMITPLLMSK